MRLWVILFLLAPLVANSATNCELQQITTASGDGRVFKVSFPDKRKITVVGHVHGNREIPTEIGRIPLDKFYFRRASAVLSRREVQLTLSHYREDITLLKESLKEGIGFVGYETLPEGVDPWIELAETTKDRMIGVAARHGKPASFSISDAILLMAGAPGHFLVNEPGLMRGIRQVGMEDREAMNSEGPRVSAMELALKELVRAAQKDKKVLSDIRLTESQIIFDVYPFNDPFSPEFQVAFLNSGSEDVPVQYRDLLRAYLSTSLEYMKATRARDLAVARNLMSQKSSGIHFVGLMHAPAIANELLKVCQSMESLRPANNSPPSVTR